MLGQHPEAERTLRLGSLAGECPGTVAPIGTQR
jgi:hypothetical protein